MSTPLNDAIGSNQGNGPPNGPSSPAARIRREQLRHKTNHNVRLAADFHARSAVGCSEWLARPSRIVQATASFTCTQGLVAYLCGFACIYALNSLPDPLGFLPPSIHTPDPNRSKAVPTTDTLQYVVLRNRYNGP